MREIFHKIARRTSEAVGSSQAFICALLLIIAWAIIGPAQDYSDTWQLVINTTTTILTFLMVFLIQNTQNRDARAIHLKLDELIRSNVHARNHLIDLESLSEDELDRLHSEFCQAKKITEERIEDIEQRRQKKKKPQSHIKPQ